MIRKFELLRRALAGYGTDLRPLRVVRAANKIIEGDVEVVRESDEGIKPGLGVSVFPILIVSLGYANRYRNILLCGVLRLAECAQMIFKNKHVKSSERH